MVVRTDTNYAAFFKGRTSLQDVVTKRIIIRIHTIAEIKKNVSTKIHPLLMVFS